MRILMVSDYPPTRDGIGQYAVQEASRLRSEGHEVEVLSPAPSAAHHHLRLASLRGPLALAKRVRGYDKVLVQYQTDLFFPPGASRIERAIISVGLLLCVLVARDVEVRVHEVDGSGGNAATIDGLAARAFWLAVPTVTVHTDAERAGLAAGYGRPPERVRVVDHGASFEPRANVSRREARAALGLPADEFVFLSIGFVQWHKGFHRAVTAFATAGVEASRLDIVGSVRVETGGFVDYADLLRDLVDQVPGAHLHLDYVSDEAFDTWLIASDAVVLPYEHIWSSGVIERAALFDRPVIATRVGGLAEQAAGRATLVDDEIGLMLAMRQAAVERGHSAMISADRRWPDAATTAELQELIRRQAGDDPAGGLIDLGPEGRSRLFALAQKDPARMHPLSLPRPDSLRSASRMVKRAVQAATAWQLEPIVARINQLHEAVVRAEGGEWKAAERGRLPVRPEPVEPSP